MGKKMPELADDVKRALDELPLHVGLLTNMFRKHGAKTSRTRSEIDATDRQALQSAQSVGWKGDGPLPDDVAFTEKGRRPDPETYLDKDYIEAHLAKFKDGASRIYVSDSLTSWGPGNQGSTFVIPTSDLERMLKETNGDPLQLGEKLGMDPVDYFVGKDLEVRHFKPEELTNLRLASGNEGGANSDWIPGGLLPTGIPEAVIDIPTSATGTQTGGYEGGMFPGFANSMPK